MAAKQILHHKALVHGHYVLELEIFEIGDPVRYPSGVKYSIICVDSLTGNKVLLDNHHPKGPHLHLNDIESDYTFSDVATLMKDFSRLVFDHLGVKI